MNINVFYASKVWNPIHVEQTKLVACCYIVATEGCIFEFFPQMPSIMLLFFFFFFFLRHFILQKKLYMKKLQYQKTRMCYNYIFYSFQLFFSRTTVGMAVTSPPLAPSSTAIWGSCSATPTAASISSPFATAIRIARTAWTRAIATR